MDLPEDLERYQSSLAAGITPTAPWRLEQSAGGSWLHFFQLDSQPPPDSLVEVTYERV